MHLFIKTAVFAAISGISLSVMAAQQPLQYEDVFQLEFVSEPQISSDGDQVVFVRNRFDQVQDKRIGSLWLSDTKTGQLRPLVSEQADISSPLWSEDGKKLAFISSASGKPQIHIRWMDNGQSGQISHLPATPSGLSWSPDGKWLVFSMFTPKKAVNPVTLPGKPEKNDWAKAPVYIDTMQYRADGRGYLAAGYRHIYLMAADGGTPIQMTSGDFDHGGDISWQNDSKAFYFSANRQSDKRAQAQNSEVYKLTIADKNLTQVTDRFGPDHSPALSSDGKWLAYLGYDDKKLAHQANQLYVKNLQSGEVKALTADLDRAIDSFSWDGDSDALYIQYDDQAQGKIALQPLNGKRKVLVDQVGGGSYSRPYTGGSFSVSDDGDIAFTQMSAQAPAELGFWQSGKKKQLTELNKDLQLSRDIGEVEEFWVTSSVDQRKLHSWLILPPNFDKTKKYPLILEIHGGPHTAYGAVFAMELQLMAAQGYVVLYTNPRGSTSYGMEFANLIHHKFPSEDYNDLMDVVDATVAKGFIDPDQLFVTGGSGGGLLTSWIVGHTDRFKAAVAVNPVINWFSFVLNADMYNYFSQYWFPGMPWEKPEHYLKHSPISYVGNVKTPTMLMTGEADHRTPISETEQFYQALQLRGIETAMVRIPGASHGIHIRPSNMMAKPAYITYWFNKYKK
ncbi:MAG: S9 family peptidase [Gammaproteobacteria bacterium]|nr:S9 family peptidase [Gammaproteobacteria bacterium]MBU2059085.1 S9 family peptidase [Gammaproteobacteria bacterium]MBU2173636.1 S9 family peptidase [Gammaproteobacteria bacterium]MBU2246792.1 S9 family peptidase [Gammaproteobacteria bacterium]MBU2343784.1 S9 family peptidase [Gammaproteobacteria bacterium]